MPKPLVIEEFDGVIQTFDDAVTRLGGVKWAYGLIDTEDRTMMRLGGCFPLACSNTTGGSVIGLCQLHFHSCEALIEHRSSRRFWIDSADITPCSSAPVTGVQEFGMGL